MKRSLFLATICSAVVLFAASAFGVDGTVLINQNTYVNGLPGCPTGGSFPIIICQPGSYRLSSSLRVEGAYADAIDIRADHVTLDLNGFSIIGPGAATSQATGILASGHSYVTVANGTVSGFYDAVDLDTYAETVRALTVNGNSDDGVIIGSGTVSESDADGNGMIGINILYDGSILRSRAASNTIGILSGGNALVSENQLQGNRTGVSFSGADPNSANGSVTNNLIANSATGLFASANTGYGSNTFVSNTTDTYGGISMQNNVCSNRSKC